MTETNLDRKMLLIITHAHDDTERANLALALGASMVSEDYDLTIRLFGFEPAGHPNPGDLYAPRLSRG